MLNCLIADASRLDICSGVNVSSRDKLKVPRPAMAIVIRGTYPTWTTFNEAT